MNQMSTAPITIDESWQVIHSAGALSPFKQLLLECQAEIRPDVQETLALADHIGGALLESATSTPLSASFMAQLSERLGQEDATDEEPTSGSVDENPEWMPAALSDYLRRAGHRLKWRAAGRGVQKAHLARSPSGERLYLLRARPGFQVPRHSDSGQEWTLILSGGYKAGSNQFLAGDLHQEDEHSEHDLRIDDDGPCISLVADEGRLKFSSPVLKWLQPLLGL